MKRPVNHSEQYLRDVLKVAPSHVISRVLLEHGRPFERTVPTAQRGSRLCYFNAQQLASERKLLYCEGYAVSGDLIPMEHGWCIDRSTLTVHDPTWSDGHHYFGVALERRFVAKVQRMTGGYGVLSGLWLCRDWPTLEADLRKACRELHG